MSRAVLSDEYMSGDVLLLVVDDDVVVVGT
jgi:hypothetical protein